jgi:glutamate synthase domain-containing protein 3
MDDAYNGKIREKSLNTHKGKIVFCLDDLADMVGKNPTKSDIEQLVPSDCTQLSRLISEVPSNKLLPIWGFLTSIAAEKSPEPINITGRDYVGHELSFGTIISDEGADHVGEKMKGGRLIVKGKAGNYLGQEMIGGGIVAKSCKNYGFRNMRGGWGVIFGDAGNSFGLGNSGGKLLVKGNTGDQTCWLMRGGRVIVKGDAGDYLGLYMKGGDVLVYGKAGSGAGCWMKGGQIIAATFGSESGAGAVGGKIFERDLHRDS